MTKFKSSSRRVVRDSCK